MFSFFRKFKTAPSDADSDKTSGSPSPATPARRREDKGKDKSSSRERDVTDVKKKSLPQVPQEEVKSSPEPAAVSRRNFLMSLATPADLTMTIRTQVEEQPSENELVQQRSGSQEKISALEQQVERQLEELQTEKRSLVNQEARFQEQLAELTAQVTARDNESNKLMYQMEDLQRDVLIKGSGMERFQAELAAAHKESECMRRRLRQLEENLSSFKQKNRELQDELEKKAEELQSSSEESDSDSERVAELEGNVKEMEDKVQQLQTQLDEVRLERDKLEKNRAQIDAEREEEMNIVQLALEEALEEKALIQVRFEQDFEKLRTVNTDREQQLLDDFEWKLREVEQVCKRRLEEKDKTVNAGRKELELKLKLAEQQLKELPQLKAYEAEVVQLRGLTHEQQRSLRASSRQMEQLQVSERILKEEIIRLKTQLDKEKSHGICMMSLHEKKVSDNEKKFQTRLDQQKSDITAQWEDRLRRECSRLKTELDQLHREEKHLAVESVKVQKEQEMRTAKQNWDQRMQDCLKEISSLKDRLTEKDTYYHGELEKAQTNADRDIFELRRKLDKIDLSYQEQMEKLSEKHEREMEQLNWESERKIQQLEQNWQLQMSSTRATLELVKEQMERDAQDRLDAADEKHHKQLDVQWERLVNEKEKAVLALEEKHRTQVELIKTELEKASRNYNSKENEQLLEVIANLQKQLQGQTDVISDLQGNVDLLQGGMQVLNQEISTQSTEMQRVQTQAAHRVREREAQLEAEQRKKLVQLKDRFATEAKQWQEQTKALRDQFQQKLNYVAKLLQESERRYKNRESRKEDLDTITQLKHTLEEHEHEITSLTEEKRCCQLELMSHKSTYKHLFGVQPLVGVLDPLQHHRKKGLKDMGDQPTSGQTTSSVPPLSSFRLVHKSKSVEPNRVQKAGTCGLVSRAKSYEALPVCPCASQSTESSVPVQAHEDLLCSTLQSPSNATTNQVTCGSQDNKMTFDPVDVPDSKMSILLSNHKSKITNNLETRSKSVDAPENHINNSVLTSTSTPSLQ